MDAFRQAGLRDGGTDNGAPGLRPAYHPSYYAAFLIDPAGNHIEAVCHQGTQHTRPDPLPPEIAVAE